LIHYGRIGVHASYVLLVLFIQTAHQPNTNLAPPDLATTGTFLLLLAGLIVSRADLASIQFHQKSSLPRTLSQRLLKA
jgi:hypothetical protein